MDETIVCIILGEDVCLDTDSFVEGIDCQSQRNRTLLSSWWHLFFVGRCPPFLRGEVVSLISAGLEGAMMITEARYDNDNRDGK